MADRYLKRVMTIIAIALSILAFQSISTGLFQTHAQTKPARHCEWTYISDQGFPNIGKDGTVDFGKGPNWKRLSDEGWELKIAVENKFIFERCLNASN